MSKLILQRVLSYLLFALLLAFLACSVRFQGMQNSLFNHVGQLIGGYLANVAQAVTGGSRQSPHGGDLLGCLMFLIMLTDLITRHSNRLYWFQHWAATHLSLSPTNMIAFSVGIALSYRNSTVAANAEDPRTGHPPSYVQLLILLIFSTAMYSLFSASDPPEDEELSISYRLTTYKELSIGYCLTTRVMEYSMYTCFFPYYPAIWHSQIMVPLGLLVCVSRSNQIFRLWQNNQVCYQDFHDHVIVKQKFQRLYELASKRIERDLGKIHWPRSSSSYRGYSTDLEADDENRLATLIAEAKKAGMYGYKAWKPFSQYCFFWSAGSGVLLASGITLSTTMLIAGCHEQRESEGWSVMGIFPTAGVFLFVVVQSLPAFVVFLADINNPEADPEADWMAWFCQIRSFMNELVTEGIPLGKMRGFVEQEPPWYVAALHGFEGLELVSYTAVYALARLIGLGLLFCILNLARKMKLGLVLHWWWAELEPNLAFYSAKITAPDVMRVKFAILQAEYALDTRIQLCTAKPTSSDIRSIIQLRNVKVLLEDLDKALRGEQNVTGFILDEINTIASNDDDESKQLDDVEKQANERKQAIAAALYISTMEELMELKGCKDVNFPVDIAARLQPILSLLHRLHLVKKHGCEAKNLNRVVDKLNFFANDLALRSKCHNKSDVKLMRVQLQVSMLLYHFDERSILHSITGITLHEWLEIRRLVPGIEFCDFIS